MNSTPPPTTPQHAERDIGQHPANSERFNQSVRYQRLLTAIAITIFQALD